MDSRPLVSVIVPVWNARAYLEETVASVRAQTFGGWELLLSDDGSTDGSGELCDRLQAEDARIRAVHTPHRGVSHVRNAGLAAARGEWAQFLDSDDLLEPRALETCLERAGDADAVVFGLTKFPGGDCVRPAAEPLRAERGELLWRDGRFRPQAVIYRSACTRLFRRSAIRQPFDETVDFGEDVLFNIRFFAACGAVQLLPDVLYRYRRGQTGTLSGRWDRLFPYAAQVYRTVLEALPGCHEAAESAGAFFAQCACRYAYFLAARPELTPLQKVILLDAMRSEYLPETSALRGLRLPDGDPYRDLWAGLTGESAEETLRRAQEARKAWENVYREVNGDVQDPAGGTGRAGERPL